MKQIELNEHTRFGPLVIKEPASYQPEVVMYKPEPRCGCGCGEIAESGYNYDGEMFATQSCVIRMMISEGWLKEVG